MIYYKGKWPVVKGNNRIKAITDKLSDPPLSIWLFLLLPSFQIELKNVGPISPQLLSLFEFKIYYNPQCQVLSHTLQL